MIYPHHSRTSWLSVGGREKIRCCQLRSVLFPGSSGPAVVARPELPPCGQAGIGDEWRTAERRGSEGVCSTPDPCKQFRRVPLSCMTYSRRPWNNLALMGGYGTLSRAWNTLSKYTSTIFEVITSFLFLSPCFRGSHTAS